MTDIGLVLGGGGAKGAYELGAWSAISETGLNNKIKIYSGTSIGAMNCALIQMMDYKEASKIWLKYDLENFFMPNRINYNKILEIVMNIKRGKNIDFNGILSRDGLNELFNKLNLGNLESIRNDFYVGVVNITKIPEKKRLIKPVVDWHEGRKTGITQYINLKNTDKEYIVKILSASSSLPVLYTPVEIDGEYYVDGGVNDNLPIYPIYKEGYRKIIVVSCERINYFNIMRKYPLAEILLIQPSRYLGNLINGTLNFNRSKLNQSYRLGYHDARNAIKRSKLEFLNK